MAFGWLDGRWVRTTDTQSAVEGLKNFPEVVGDWRSVKDFLLPEATLNTLRCYGYSYRSYVNPNSGTQVTVAVLYGPRGPIAVHTPEICYTSAGVTPKAERERVELNVGGEEHSVWKVEMLSERAGTPALEVCYGWSDGHQWHASAHPRFWPTDKLFKIQLSSPPAQPGKESECVQFLKEFLPALKEVIATAK